MVVEVEAAMVAADQEVVSVRDWPSFDAYSRRREGAKQRNEPSKYSTVDMCVWCWWVVGTRLQSQISHCSICLHRILEYRVDFVTTSSGLNRIFSLVMPVFWCLIVLWFFYLFMILRFEAIVALRITKSQSIACHCWQLLISSLIFFSLNSIMLQLQQTRSHRSRLPGVRS